MKKYCIIDIQHVATLQTRIDGKYPDRIGCIGHIDIERDRMLFTYLYDNQGDSKEGTLVTSTINFITEQKEDNIIKVQTRNSIYILKEVE